MNAFARIDKETFFRFAARRRHQRFEYVRGIIVQQMAGGTRGHGLIGDQMRDVLRAVLDLTIWSVGRERGVDTGPTVRYPDVVVEPASEPLSSIATARPALIVEVMSPSSIADDLEYKPTEYLAMPSLQAYLVLSQHEPACLVWLRGADGTMPAEPALAEGWDQVMRVAGLGIAVPLEPIYRGIVSRG